MNMEQMPQGPKKESAFEKLKDKLKHAVGIGAAVAVSSTASGEVKEKNNDTELLKNKIEISIDTPQAKKLENTISYSGGKDSTKQGLQFYYESKTKEGGITPTGKNNSFAENVENLSEEDVYKIAQEFGFSTESNKAFQEDAVNYAKKFHPEILENVLREYGSTNAGDGVEGLVDGHLGVRTFGLLKELKKKKESLEEQVSSVETKKQPEGNYVVNIRGDEKGSRGIYYFFRTEAELKKFTTLVPGANIEIRGGYGQASYDMNFNVFKDKHANSVAAKAMLNEQGGWTRNPNNDKEFLPIGE